MQQNPRAHNHCAYLFTALNQIKAITELHITLALYSIGMIMFDNVFMTKNIRRLCYRAQKKNKKKKWFILWLIIHVIS